MHTILISGAGTDVGKTHVLAALAHAAAQNGLTVQLVKPVQSGVTAGNPTDVATATALAGLPPTCAHTLRLFPAPLAPLDAAAAVGAHLDWPAILAELQALPQVDIRLIEGAGGLAVPLTPAGWDWADFASAARVTAVVLVVRAELGAINQSRLVMKYYATKIPAHPPSGIFLNAIRPEPPDVRQSTRKALQQIGLPVWGELTPDARVPTLHAPLRDWLRP